MRNLMFGLFAGLSLFAAQSAQATPVQVTFSGTIPQANSFFSYKNTVADPYTDSQLDFFNGFGWGSSYSFTFQYDTSATATDGKFAATLLNGAVGSSDDYAGYDVTLRQYASGGREIMEFQIGKVENFSASSNFYTYLTFLLFDGDDQFYDTATSLRDADIGPLADYATAEFRIQRNQSGAFGYRFYGVDAGYLVTYNPQGTGEPGGDPDSGENPGAGNGDPVSVPLPPALALFGSGLLGFGLLARTRRRHG